MQMAMRAVFVVIVGSVLSILAMKYARNDLNDAVPMMNPAVAAEPS